MTETGTVHVDFDSDDFRKITHTAWNNLGETQPAYYTVSFAQPFPAPPAVLLSITGIDAVGGQSLHFDLLPADITPTGFRLQVSLTQTNNIKGVTVAWLAVNA